MNTLRPEDKKPEVLTQGGTVHFQRGATIKRSHPGRTASLTSCDFLTSKGVKAVFWCNGKIGHGKRKCKDDPHGKMPSPQVDKERAPTYACVTRHTVFTHLAWRIFPKLTGLLSLTVIRTFEKKFALFLFSCIFVQSVIPRFNNPPKISFVISRSPKPVLSVSRASAVFYLGNNKTGTYATIF